MHIYCMGKYIKSQILEPLLSGMSFENFHLVLMGGIGWARNRIWRIHWPSFEAACGDYTTNSPPKDGNGSLMNSSLSLILQSTCALRSRRSRFADSGERAAVLAEREANSWYLVYLGTHPDARGRGYARKLVEYITSKVSHSFSPVLRQARSRKVRNMAGTPETCFLLQSSLGYLLSPQFSSDLPWVLFVNVISDERKERELIILV